MMIRIGRVFYLKPMRIVTSLIGGGLYVVLLVWIAKTYDIALAISLAAVTIATVAAIANLLSLQWTRDTIRPFLFATGEVSISHQNKYVTLMFMIRNSGTLPATDVELEMRFFGKDEEVTENNASSIYPAPRQLPVFPSLFPNAVFSSDYIFNKNDKNDRSLWENIEKGQVKLRIRIKYQSLRTRHLTIQTEEIQRPPWLEGLKLAPTLPREWI